MKGFITRHCPSPFSHFAFLGGLYKTRQVKNNGSPSVYINQTTSESAMRGVTHCGSPLPASTVSSLVYNRPAAFTLNACLSSCRAAIHASLTRLHNSWKRHGFGPFFKVHFNLEDYRCFIEKLKATQESKMGSIMFSEGGECFLYFWQFIIKDEKRFPRRFLIYIVVN